MHGCISYLVLPRIKPRFNNLRQTIVGLLTVSGSGIWPQLAGCLGLGSVTLQWAEIQTLAGTVVISRFPWREICFQACSWGLAPRKEERSKRKREHESKQERSSALIKSTDFFQSHLGGDPHYFRLILFLGHVSIRSGLPHGAAGTQWNGNEKAGSLNHSRSDKVE